MLSRRAALQGGTATVVAIAGAGAGAVTAAAAVDQDAHLQYLAQQHDLIYPRWIRALDIENDKQEEYYKARPKWPERLPGHMSESALFQARKEYEAKCAALHQQCGLANAERRQTELWNRLRAISDEALAGRATSFEGIKAKLRATIFPDEVERWEKNEKTKELDASESVLLSLWRDVHQAEG